jgi:hypothetical protein
VIVQGIRGGLLLFRQTDHALLSGAFAGTWAWPLAERASILVAAARHDDGWGDWELSPKLNESGRPVDFIGIPVWEHVVVYRRGIDLVEDEDPWAGCVVSLHGERLYTRPFHPGAQARIEHLSGDALDHAKRYVDHERERQSRLASELGSPWPDLEEAWRLLQVWDRLSLFVCMQPMGSGASATMPPVRGPDGADVEIIVQTPAPDTIELDPYPFAHESATFEVDAFVVEGEQWPDEQSFRHAYRTALKRIVRITARAR